MAKKFSNTIFDIKKQYFDIYKQIRIIYNKNVIVHGYIKNIT